VHPHQLLLVVVRAGPQVVLLLLPLLLAPVAVAVAVAVPAVEEGEDGGVVHVCVRGARLLSPASLLSSFPSPFDSLDWCVCDVCNDDNDDEEEEDE